MNWETAWEYIDHIEGLLGSGVVEHWLFDTAQSLPDNAIVLEIGAYLGRSTSCLALGCVGTQKHVYTIDTFCGNDTDFIHESSFYDTWESNMKLCGLLDYVTPLVGLSSSFYDSWHRPINFLFMDGSHQFEVVVADFNAFWPWVTPGSCVAAHDVAPYGAKTSHPGCYEAWHKHIAPKLQHLDYQPLAHGWRA